MKIALMGDVMLGRLVNKALLKWDAAYPWGNTLPLLNDADLRICNLECVISDVGNPWSITPKMFHFRSDEENIATLAAAGIDIVSIANNHVLDYEEEALFRMIDILDTNNIPHAGAGKDLSSAEKPAIISKKSKKTGMLAFTDNEAQWEANANKAGIFYVPIDLKDKRAKHLIKLTEELREKVDFLILSAHWGSNWGYDPPREQIPFAHTLIEAGADLIFGHSGHIFRGIEIYKSKPIIYCAGDFIDDYVIDEIERNDESFIFIVDWNGHKLKIYLFPTIINEYQAFRAEFPRSKSILSKMQKLCKLLSTSMEYCEDYGFITA